MPEPSTTSPPVAPIRVGARNVGPDEEVFLIGEVGNAHDGSVNTAHAFIDAIAKAGAHAVKFQTHIAAAEGTPRERFRVKFSYADKTRFDYWRRMEFTPEQWKDLRDHAAQAGLIFLSSPFSMEAVQLLQNLDVPAWKVGSGETNNYPMIERMARTGKPVLISTGMSYMEEIDQAVSVCRRNGAPVMVFHCTTAYPCPPEKVGLGMLAELARRHGCPVGLSDHSGDIFAGLVAAVLGASAVEAHVALSRDSFGPDVPASLTPAELKRLAEGLKGVRAMTRTLPDKDAFAREMEPMRKLFCKSVVYAADLPAGTVLREEHLVGKKPGDGVPIAQVSRFVGGRLKKDVKKDRQLAPEDVA